MENYILFQQAYKSLDDKKWTEAKQYFKIALGENPFYMPAWVGMAKAEYMLCQYELSLEHVGHYLKETPEPTKAALHLALLSIVNIAKSNIMPTPTSSKIIEEMIYKYTDYLSAADISRLIRVTEAGSIKMSQKTHDAVNKSADEGRVKGMGVQIEIITQYSTPPKTDNALKLPGDNNHIVCTHKAKQNSISLLNNIHVIWSYEINEKPRYLFSIDSDIIAIAPDWRNDMTRIVGISSAGKEIFSYEACGCRALAVTNASKTLCLTIISKNDLSNAKAYILSPCNILHIEDMDFGHEWRFLFPYFMNQWVCGSGSKLYTISEKGDIHPLWGAKTVESVNEVFAGYSMKEKKAFVKLDITPTDDLLLIKQAYRRQAKKWHPDVCDDPNATKITQDINEAYNILAQPNHAGILSYTVSVKRQDYAVSVRSSSSGMLTSVHPETTTR